MSRQRSFDWDEARRLHAEGVPMRELARRFDVSKNAILYAVNDEARARASAISSEWQKNGTCPVCGGRSSRNRKHGDTNPAGKCPTWLVVLGCVG